MLYRYYMTLYTISIIQHLSILYSPEFRTTSVCVINRRAMF